MPKLKAPPGADEANFGTERFRVDNDGTVDVPDEAVADLVHTGGFQLVPNEDDAPELDAAVIGDRIKVMHPDHIGCSFAGVSYEPNEDGSVDVPPGAVLTLLSHGFKPVEP